LTAATPPPKQTTSEWADAERRLSAESSAEPGQWRTSRVPYLREFMDAWDDPKVRDIVGMFASQGAKTEAVNNIIGCRIANYPGPMLLLQPTLDMAKAWSKDRLAPMLRDTPCLAGKVKDARTRDSGNTVLHKQFPGGHLTIVGANSAAGLSMRPIRDVFCDEPDRYPASAGTEGDPVRLAVTRTRAFFDAKRAYIGSPTVRGASRIERLMAQSDRRVYLVPCPGCGFEQSLKWSQVAWDKDESGDALPETARYQCESCGAGWNDLQRRQAVKRGRWQATAKFTGVAGFHVNALAYPWESCDLRHLVAQWLEAQGNPALLQVFINTVLAELWEEEHYTRTVDETGLIERRETVPERAGRPVIPARCALVTVGVDVQDNRFELSAYGWASLEESWLLGHWQMFGDPASDALWSDLDRWLATPWRRETGGVDWVRAACVDTGGHHTEKAYRFCEPRFRRMTPDGGRSYVFAIRGRAGPGNVWPRKPSKAKGSPVPLYTIQVDPAKEQLYGRLSIAEPGAGFVHITSSVDRGFLEGLVSEKCVTRTDKRGFPQRVWEKRRPGIRNEPLDCAAYAYAALCGLRAMGLDLEVECASLAARSFMDFPEESPPTARGVGVATPAPTPPPPARAPAARRGSWIGDRSENWLR
jgi:phage terminase large subunit GpA-like protein